MDRTTAMDKTKNSHNHYSTAYDIYQAFFMKASSKHPLSMVLRQLSMPPVFHPKKCNGEEGSISF